MRAAINMRDQELGIVRTILNACLPTGAEVRVFGSRARGGGRRGSDLDLAVDAGRPLTRAETHALANAFEESDLPYTVDVVDARSAAADFLALIAEDWRSLPMPGANGD